MFLYVYALARMSLRSAAIVNSALTFTIEGRVLGRTRAGPPDRPFYHLKLFWELDRSSAAHHGRVICSIGGRRTD